MPQNNSSPKEKFVNERDRKEITRIFALAIVLELTLLAVLTIIGITLRIFSPAEQIMEKLQNHLPTIVGVIVFLIIIKLALNLINLGINRIVRKYEGVETSGKMAGRFLTYVVWLLVGIALVALFVGDIWAYMVWVAVIIAAIIYALATPLQNIAAWFLIVMNRPFKIGDIVEMGEIQGYVVDLSLSSTMMREMGNWVHGDLFTGRFVTVPNRMVFETGVSNYTRNNKFVYDYLTLAITYESDLKKAEDLLLSTTRDLIGNTNDEFIRAARDTETRELIQQMPKEPRVFWQTMESGVELGVMYTVAMHRRFVTRSEITKRFLTIIADEADVNVAYPHMELIKHENNK